MTGHDTMISINHSAYADRPVGNVRIRAFKYTPDEVRCELCTEYAKKTGCTANGCPWLAERVEAGVVGYAEAVDESFRNKPLFTNRLRFLVRRFSGSLWENEDHSRRMDYMKAVMGFRRKRDTPKYYAAMYLLTSNRDIFERTQNCFHRTGIDFQRARLRGISPHNYTLLMAAKDLFCGDKGITQEDMADPEVIDSKAFRLIVNAILIARFGLAALSLREISAHLAR